MRSSALAKSKTASLSVVVVSTGTPTDTHRATETLAVASRELGAQLIVVASSALAKSVERNGAEFVVAPPGSTRAEMCDLGMRRAVGTIVVVRDDAVVSDARWLETYRPVLARRRAPSSAPVESVVMDTMVPGRTELADSADGYASRESKGGSLRPSVELASAT